MAVKKTWQEGERTQGDREGMGELLGTHEGGSAGVTGSTWRRAKEAPDRRIVLLTLFIRMWTRRRNAGTETTERKNRNTPRRWLQREPCGGGGGGGRADGSGERGRG